MNLQATSVVPFFSQICNHRPFSLRTRFKNADLIKWVCENQYTNLRLFSNLLLELVDLCRSMRKHVILIQNSAAWMVYKHGMDALCMSVDFEDSGNFVENMGLNGQMFFFLKLFSASPKGFLCFL